MRSGWPVVVVVLVLVVAVGVWWGSGRRRLASHASSKGADAAADGRVAAGQPPASGDAAGDDARPDADDGEDALGGPGGGPEPWSVVDLDAVKAAMPNNLYWTMSSPTKDEKILEWREQERARWNEAYGKVLSNTASVEEINAYFAHRQRLSSDYIEFAGYLLAEYGEQLPKRDVRLLKLAIDLHLKRLEEIPRQIEDAVQRHEQHEAARRAWLAEQRAFGEGGGGNDDDASR